MLVLVVLASTGLSLVGWQTCSREGGRDVCEVVHFYALTFQPRLAYTTANGDAAGTRREWFRNGQLWIEGDVVKDKRWGTWREFWPNGNLRFEGTYRDDVLDGTERWYWSDGSPEWHVGRRNGVSDGEERWWHDNGQLRRVGSYVDGERHGTFTVFDPDGGVAFSGEYAHGDLVSGRTVE